MQNGAQKEIGAIDESCCRKIFNQKPVLFVAVKCIMTARTVIHSKKSSTCGICMLRTGLNNVVPDLALSILFNVVDNYEQ